MRALAGLIGALSLGPSFAVPAGRSHASSLEDWLRCNGADVLGDTAALGRLGAAYLAEHPHEHDRDRLVRLLRADGARNLGEKNPIGLSLIDGIARDWREHDVVVIAGWVYARTEARICAFLHLISGARA